VLADEATAALNQAAFGLPDLTDQQAAEITAQLRQIRALSGDLDIGGRLTGVTA
jgi:hypothetical protein